MASDHQQKTAAPMAKRILMTVRRAIAAVPGLRSLYEGIAESPGSWLYRHPNISWLSDPSLVRQLPRPYRLFAGYCSAQRRDPIGAEVLLRGIIALRRIGGATRQVSLQVNDATVFLDLEDPRFLAVPRELKSLPDLLRHFLGPGDTFIDIGANHGSYSVAAAGLVGHEGFVVAIEPQPQLAHVVQMSLAASQARFEVHQIACSDSTSDASFFIPVATSGSAGLSRDFSALCYCRTIQVAIHRIDDVIDLGKLAGRVFIKLDVEGSEVAVLRGARRMIEAVRPAILVEVNPMSLAAAGFSDTSLANLLLELGYDRFVTRNELQAERPLTSPVTERDIIVLHSSTVGRDSQ